MSRFVEHEKRRQRILSEAARVFTEDGYQGATYQKIAQRCGVSRTTLYQYFRNKQQIFQYSIKQVTDLLAQGYEPLLYRQDLSPLDKLKQVMEHTVQGCYDHKDILVILFDYLQWVKKQGEDPRARVHRRTIRMRLTLVRLINRAVAQGEIPTQDGGKTADLLFSLLESALLRMVLGYTREPDYTLSLVNTALKEISGQRY